MSAEAERLYWRLQTECDDEGRTEDHPQLIWATCVPLVPGASAESVHRWLDELHDAGLLVRYEVEGDHFLEVTKWGDYQHPKKPKASTHPSPSVGNRRGTKGEPGGNLGRLERSGEEGSGVEGRGGDASAEPVGNSFASGGDGEAPSPLLNLLAKLPGEQDEKAAWLAETGPQIEVDAEASRAGPKPQNAAQLTVRYYRQYLKGDRVHRGAAERAEREARIRAWGEQHDDDARREAERVAEESRPEGSP